MNERMRKKPSSGRGIRVGRLHNFLVGNLVCVATRCMHVGRLIGTENPQGRIVPA